MWQELGITDLAGLKAKLDSPEIRALPRMGVKTIDNIKKAIRFQEQAGDRVPLGIAVILTATVLPSTSRSWCR